VSLSFEFHAYRACRRPYKNISFLAGDDESRRLTDVHFLLQVPIQEHGFHIHVVDLPPFLSRQREEEAHKLHACNQSEDLIEINPFLLHELTCDQPSLMLDDLPCLVPLQLIHPF
jgi:hypothetical protein